MFLKTIAVLNLITVAVGLPARNDGLVNARTHKQIQLSGVSGKFTYPETGTYGSNEFVLVKLPIQSRSVFILEQYDLEVNYDYLTILHTGNDQAAVDETLTGTSNVPIQYLEDIGDVTLVFQSDATIENNGFTVSWALRT